MIRLFLFGFCLSLLACSGNEPLPKNILPGEKMEAVLWDVLQADEMINNYLQTDSLYKSLSKRSALYDTIFAIHKVSKEDFKKSILYYESHPKLLKPLLDSLQKRTTVVIPTPISQ